MQLEKLKWKNDQTFKSLRVSEESSDKVIINLKNNHKIVGSQDYGLM